MSNVTYTTKGTIDFGNKYKGKPISELAGTAEGRNYLVWMKIQGFTMSAQLFQQVDGWHKKNKLANGHDYEVVPGNYQKSGDGIDSDKFEDYHSRRENKHNRD